MLYSFGHSMQQNEHVHRCCNMLQGRMACCIRLATPCNKMNMFIVVATCCKVVWHVVFVWPLHATFEAIFFVYKIMLQYNHSHSKGKWLTNDFLEYLSKWKSSVDHREGNFSTKERQKMFISQQTYERLQITAKSAVDLSRYLLSSGMKFVLTEKFNQDVVEEYFMRQRSLGRRNENPDLY